MSFFGVTRLGDERMFKTHQERHDATVRSCMTDAPLEAYLRAFQAVARDNCCKAGSEIRRALLPRVLSDVLHRPATLTEMNVVLRFIEVGPGNLTIRDFAHGIQQALDYYEEHYKANKKAPSTSVGNQEKKHQTSYTQLKEDRDKYIPNPAPPSNDQDIALTTNQEYGWEDKLKLDTRNKEYFPLNKTDVTINEGICLDNYYKMF